MAEIIPFRALHYNPHQVPKLSDVVTQPYDKITSEMQARYYGSSPLNIVRVIRGVERPGDDPNNNVYIRALSTFHEWVENQVLISDTEPAIYPYYQDYAVPGQSGLRKERHGFIALCRLQDYKAGIVHRHEETLSGPKADRLQLLKTTRAHFGQIFMLYSDPKGEIESALAAKTRGKPWETAVDEHSTRHSVWRVAETHLVEQVVEAMRPRKLVIADGHHRYETALAFRDFCRSRREEAERAEYVMVTCVRMETEGLTVLPTHRVIHSLPNYRWGRFIGDAQEFFLWEEIKLEGTPAQRAEVFAGKLERAGRAGPTIGVYAGQDTHGLLTLRQDQALTTLLPDVPASLARLDVVLLHRILLERVLGIAPQAVREEKNLHYERDFAAALGSVDDGKAQLSFLMNPTPVLAVWENALAGNVLPQKSTDFYPKLLTGLAGYWLNNPAGI